MTEETDRRLRFIINTFYFATIAVLIYLSLRYVVSWVLPFVLAFLIVSIVHPFIRWMKKKLKIERETIALIIMALVYIFIFASLAGIIALITIQLKEMITSLPAYLENTLYPAIIDINKAVNNFLHDLPPEWRLDLTNLQSEIMKTLQSLLLSLSTSVSGFTAKIPSFFIAFIFTIMLSFFISTQYASVLKVLKSVLPQKAHRVVSDIKKAMVDTVLKYFRATLTLMCITAAELTVGLFFLGADNFAVVAVGIAIFDALPLFGTGAIMIPWVVLELIKSNFTFAFWLAMLYVGVTLVRNIIEPKIVSDKLGLNPILSLCAIYLGFRTFGVIGMIIMPIIMQIFMALHKSGSMDLLRKITHAQPGPQDSDMDVLPDD